MTDEFIREWTRLRIACKVTGHRIGSDNVWEIIDRRFKQDHSNYIDVRFMKRCIGEDPDVG